LASQFGVEAARMVQQQAFGRMVTLDRGRLGSIALCGVAGRHRQVPLTHHLVETARQIGISLGQHDLEVL
jgi:6-phosphofructokinase 1